MEGADADRAHAEAIRGRGLDFRRRRRSTLLVAARWRRLGDPLGGHGSRTAPSGRIGVRACLSFRQRTPVLGAPRLCCSPRARDSCRHSGCTPLDALPRRTR
jgi:hypothetical protein